MDDLTFHELMTTRFDAKRVPGCLSYQDATASTVLLYVVEPTNGTTQEQLRVKVLESMVNLFDLESSEDLEDLEKRVDIQWIDRTALLSEAQRPDSAAAN